MGIVIYVLIKLAHLICFMKTEPILLIHYQTELACQEQITCKAKVYVDHTEDGTGAEVIDLTPLISTNKNYQAKVDAATINEHRLPNSIKILS
uniref:Uncharacterized protein n=1 Tax=Glossina palpalis gambiensis TaxID=67801 RepID=A0A1B0BUN5_9MUSC